MKLTAVQITQVKRLPFIDSVQPRPVEHSITRSVQTLGRVSRRFRRSDKAVREDAKFYAMLKVIEHKLETVMHLPKSERYAAAGFTKQERAWLSFQKEKYGL